jgi:hypothetical protein
MSAIFTGDSISQSSVPAKVAKSVKARKLSWVEAAPLCPWMEDWVHWFCGLDHIPNINEQVIALRKYSKQPCGSSAVAQLKRRKDVADLLERFLADRTQLAKAILVRNAPGDLDIRRAALTQAATEMQSADTSKERMIAARLVVVATEGLTNKVWPTKEERVAQAPVVIINLGHPSSFAARHALKPDEVDLPALPPVDYEIVNPEIVE